MSSILKALKKLEQDPNGGGSAPDLRQRKTGPEKAFGRGTRRLRPRTVAFYVLLVPVLAIGGWLLLKYAPLLTEKSQPGKPLPQAKGAIATDASAGAAPASKKTDLAPKARGPSRPRIPPRTQKAPAKKTVVTSRTGVRVLEKKEGNPPAAVNRTQAKTRFKPPEKKPQVASKSFKPPDRSDPSRTDGKPEVDESSVLAGFSVQAIAWSKIPAERIAVINGAVVREGGFVEGIHVIQIGLDEVYLKKGENTWMLKCGR